MLTEIILLGTGIFEFTAMFLIGRRRKDFLIGAIAINLILVSLFGGQLISIFGFITNAGNVFYIAISLALYLLIENYGHKEAGRGIWISFSLVMLFTILAQLAIGVHGISSSSAFEKALRTTFDISPRIALASLLAFLLSQHINLYLYERLKRVYGGSKIWLRCNVSNIATQIVDSFIFFLVAFTLIAPSSITEIMLTGFAVKVIFGVLVTLFLYLNHLLNRPSNTPSRPHAE